MEHPSWKPITESEFTALFAEQYAELDDDERPAFDRHAVKPWLATVRRTEAAGDETVYVVSQADGGGLYFDDVEYGFNISLIDPSGRILQPGGSQLTLKQAANAWFQVDRNRR